MNNDTPITNAAWSAAKEQTDTNDTPDWGCVAHDMRDKCAELERDNNHLRDLLREARPLIMPATLAAWDTKILVRIDAELSK